MGRMSSDEKRVQWIDKLHGITNPVIYIVDNANTTGPHLETNHGREAAVYMRYIIDNYDSLPDIVFFWHNDEVVWHNNLLMKWNSVGKCRAARRYRSLFHSLKYEASH